MKTCFETMDRILIILAAFAAASCTVIERRDGCPCWVSADVSCIDPIKTSNAFGSIALFFENDAGFACSDYLTCEDLDSSSVKIYELPRAVTDIVALSGNGVTMPSGPHFVPALAEDGYPRLHSWHKRSDLAGEQALIKPFPHKQHCVIRISLEDGFRPESGDLSLHVSGEVCGLDLYSLRPLEGVFEARMPVGPDGRADVAVPRQYPGDRLLARIFRGDEEISCTDVSLLMQNAGYDWGREDLDDISLVIGNFYVGAQLEICPWDSAVEDDVVI